MTILSLALTCALLSAPIVSGVSARAEAGNMQERTERLVLPDSYEQYLPLVSPSDIAISESFTAIADGTSIFVYNRETDQYAQFTHSFEVTELQFSGRTLYFLDKQMNLHTMRADAPSTAQNVGLACSSFVIDSDVVYYMTVSGNNSTITPAYLGDLTSVTDPALVKDGLPSSPKPTMTVYNGNLYYSHESAGFSYIRNLHHAELEYRLPQSGICSVAIMNGILYYTDTQNGNFYAYDFAHVSATAEPLHEPIAGCSAITAADDGFIYVVQGSSVRQYSPETKSFTGFEIAAASASENRLSGATASRYFGGSLYIADKANRRLSVTNLSTGEHTIYPAELEAEYLATDGKNAVLATAQKAVLIDLESGVLVRSFEGMTGNILGVECVYGTYYFLTNNNHFYRASMSESGEWHLSGAPKTVSTPKLLTSDIYGDLYVACADNKVYRFTESEFTDSSATGTEIATVPTETKQLAVDFDRTVYALHANAVKVCADAGVEYPLSKSLVFSQSDATELTSFSFDMSSGATYLLYDGNFVVEAYDVPFPALNSIPVRGADEAIFGSGNALFSLVEIPERTLLVEYDMSRLNGANVFPYLSHARTKQTQTAIKLGESDRFNLVAVFDGETKIYTAAIVEKASCADIPEETYLKKAAAFAECQTGYLTNAIDLYKYPYLTELLTLTALPKNAEVTVLGQIDDLDYRYYLVEYSNGETTYRGYLPQSYVTDFDPRPPQSESATFGDTETDRDSLWRLAFILLGCASIGILADYLILRKKD